MTLTSRGAVIIAAIVVWYLLVARHGLGEGWWVVANIAFGIFLVGFIAGGLLTLFGEDNASSDE